MQIVPSRGSLRQQSCYVTWLLLVCWPAFAIGQTKVTRGLVDKLATTNSPFVIRGEPGENRASHGVKFDQAESDRIDAAVKKAIRQSEAIWPELVDHLGDERYCMTVGIDAGYARNWTVGDICQHIIGETLSEAYYRHMPGTKENFNQFRIPAVAQDKIKLREWCLACKDRKLFELQIEQCEWAITEVKASDMDPEEKQRITVAVEKEIEALEKSQVAIPCTSSF